MSKPLNERIASVEASLQLVLARMDEDREEHRQARKSQEGFLRRIEDNQKQEITALNTRVTELEATKHRFLGMRDLVVAVVSILASLGITIKIHG